MRNCNVVETETTDPFADPVGYLACLGIASELIAFIQELPEAA